MKKILIGLLLLVGGFANAQIGIDLTEMIPAPDSGYMIITTGDEYPDRGLQKYVKASDILGIDTMFQNGDSLCILMRSEEAYRCFPVHQEVRLEKVDGGLRVCWEQRDTIQEETYWLHFSDEGRPRARARSTSDLEIGDQDADIEIKFRTEKTGTTYIGGTSAWLSSEVRSGYSFGYAGSGFGRTMISDGTDWIMNFSGNNDQIRDGEWHTMRMKWTNSTGGAILFVDGVSIDTVVNEDMIGKTLNNQYPFVLGRDGSLGSNGIIGDISYFRFNDEVFQFHEQEGDVTVGSKGTVLDLDGAEWNYQPLIIDTSHHCEIIPLTDTRVIDVFHTGDSIKVLLSDSIIFAVRDSFIPQENIIGWIDERIPDTVFFAKTSTATKAIEFGDTLELKGGAININIPVEVDYFTNTNQLEICWTEIELPDQELQDEGMGSEFNQGGGQVQQLPADTIRLCDTIQLNDVYIDTVFHDGDSMRFVRNDGKSWAVKDSFRTDDDIVDLIEMMYDPQWLTVDRDGNEVTISISDGNSISFIDSVRSPGYIAQVARDSFPKESKIIADPVVLIPCDSMGVGSVGFVYENTNIYPALDSSINPNLIPNSEDFESWSKFQGSVAVYSDSTITEAGNLPATRIQTSGGSHILKTLRNISAFLTTGENYSVSIFLKNIGNKPFHLWGNAFTFPTQTISPGEYRHVQIIGESTGASQVQIRALDAADSLDFLISHFKVEKGEKATSWVPYDLEGLITLHPHNATATLDSGRLEIIPEAPTGWVDVHVDYGTYQDSVRIPFATLCDTDLSGIRDTLDIHDTQISDLEYFRDTLNPVKVVDFTRSGDSLYLDLSNGQTFAVRDSFLTEAEIQDMVNKSWLLKDGGVPDNATDTVFRDGVAVIEGVVWKRSIRADGEDVELKQQSFDSYTQLFYDHNGDLVMANGINIPAGAYTLGVIDSHNPDNNVQLWIQKGQGVRFQPYGTGQYEATPTYLLGVDASGYVKEVRPTSGIDTIIHLGDSVFFDFDDKTFTIRDSVRSDADIITLIEANRIFQQLGRSGDFITLSEGGGQVLDLHLKDAIHTGDSVKLVLSDGRNITFRDSSLSVDAVRDMILEEIPETVFYVKQGDVTAPVNWGDVVELENGEVNVNMPTKVKMIDSLNALEVCIWQVVDRTTVDTVVSDYVEFNGTNSSYGQRANINAGIDLELPFSFRTSFSDLSDPEQTILSNGGEAGAGQFVFRLNANGDFLFRNGDRIIQFPITDLEENVVYDIELRQVNDSVGLFLDGVLKGTAPAIQSGMAVSQIARQSTNIRPFNGRLYEIKSANAAVPIDEGSGNRLYGTGDIEYVLSNIGWGVDTVIRVIEQIDTLFQCDTIYLSDIFISDATFENDTLKISRNDGKLFAIEIQASGGDGIDTMYSTSDSLYIITSTGRTLSAGVAKGDKGDGLEYNWDGTRLGVRVENSGDPFVYVDLKGDKGDTGDDGREVELRVDSEMIQWRYVGDTWQTLIPLSALKGEKGDPGPGLEYHWNGTQLGVRKVGDPSYDYVDLKGEKGEPGDVVGDINIYKDDGVILEDRTAIIEEDNTLRFDLKEKAGFEIGHYSQDGNDSKLINHRTSDNSFMLEIQEIEKDTLWNSRILATSKGIGLRNHKSYGSSISYGTMGVDTSGSYILNLVKDNPGVLFAGRRQFLNRVTDDGHALWDTIGMADIGITPADTARWGAGGSYTLERDNYRMHLRDASGASKGSFQLQGSDGVEIYPQSNNVFRISGQGITVPSYTTQVSGPAFNLRRDNSTVSTVNFFGTGGINIGGTGSTITIDGSAIGGTQSLGFNTSLNQTTLSGGGGSFRIVGGSNTSVSLSAGGVYTISATGGGSMPSYSFNSQGAMLQLSEDGIQRGSYEVRAGTGLSLSTSGTALNRVVTINASGGTSPWTVSGSNIYRNSGVTVGGTTVGNQFRSYLRSHFYDAVGIFEGSNQRGEMYGSGGDFIITNPTGQTTRITSGHIELDGHVAHKLARPTIATLTNPVNEIPSNAGSTNFSFSTARAGTIRYVLNGKSSSITVQGVTIPAGEGKAFMRGTSAWYPISP